MTNATVQADASLAPVVQAAVARTTVHGLLEPPAEETARLDGVAVTVAETMRGAMPAVAVMSQVRKSPPGTQNQVGSRTRV